MVIIDKEKGQLLINFEDSNNSVKFFDSETKTSNNVSRFAVNYISFPIKFLTTYDVDGVHYIELKIGKGWLAFPRESVDEYNELLELV